MKSIRFTLTLLLVSVAGSVLFAAPRKTKDAQPVEQTARFPYDTVAGDPLKSRIYTLPNGLKVHTTVNKREPRIYTMIGVRVGGKNDPEAGRRRCCPHRRCAWEAPSRSPGEAGGGRSPSA